MVFLKNELEGFVVSTSAMKAIGGTMDVYSMLDLVCLIRDQIFNCRHTNLR